MKKFLPLLIALIFISSCEDNNSLGLESIELSDAIVESYSRDAKMLYMYEIFLDSTNQNRNNPIIDEDEITSILKIIQAVYDLKIPERDTVFQVYPIRARYCFSLSSVSLRVNPDLSEIQNLSDEIFPTGKSELDELLNFYGFDSVRLSYSYPRFPWMTIYTDKEFNMIPVENELEELSSIEIAEFSKGCIGDGNNITLERFEDYAIISFSIGSGDCPAGCIKRRYWEFRVANGRARLMRSYEN